MRSVSRCLVVSLAAGLTLSPAIPLRAAPRSPAAARPAQSDGAFQKALIQPQQLLNQLKEPQARRPVVLQVGFKVLYIGAHIPGAIFAGPASMPQGLDALRKLAARIPRDREVVIYCGCCPMEKCPNIHPAYDALRLMGFKRLKVLDLPNDFAHDWVEKGLPIVKGPAPR